MSEKAVTGSCFCNKVSYEITGNMGVFQYCHCSRCRKVTGSAHATNIFVSPGDFKWLGGEDCITRYDPEHTKYFATAFCKHCGSTLPWLSKSGKAVIVAAGTLDADPGIRPQRNIYCSSRPEWYTHASAIPEFDEMPPAKS